MLELRRLHLGQVAHLTDVDAEHGRAAFVDEVDRAQHRAVTAERDREVEAGRELLTGARATSSSAPAGASSRHTRTVQPVAAQPRRGLARRARCATRSIRGAARGRPSGSSGPVSASCPVLGTGDGDRIRPGCGDERRRRRAARAPLLAVHEELDVAVRAAHRRTQRRRRRGGRPAASPVATRVSTSACTAGSRTMPPRPTRPRPASNCGLTSSTRLPVVDVQAARAGATVSSEMKERSATARSTSPPRSAAVRLRTLQRSRTVTRASVRNDHASWPRPTSTASTCAAPCWRRQSVKPPVDAPASSARTPSTRTANRASAAASFSPPRDT